MKRVNEVYFAGIFQFGPSAEDTELSSYDEIWYWDIMY
jgi:hypothetical protein